MASTFILVSTLFFRTIYLLMGVFFTYKLSMQSMKYKLRSLYLILLANILGVVSSMYQIYIVIVDIDSLLVSYGYADTLLGIISAFVVLAFLDFYESDHLNAGRMILATFLATLSLFSVFTAMNGELIFDGYLALIIPVFFIMVLTSAILSIGRMRKYVSPLQASAMGHLRMYYILSFGGVSVVYTVVGVLTAVSPVDNELFHFWNLSMPYIIFFIAGIYLYLGYIRFDNPAILQPQKIDRFIIISNSGMALYNYQMEIEASPIDESLLSGAITAISAVLKEATKIAGTLRSIIIGESTMMLSTIGDYTGIIFTNNQTQFLRSTLDSMMLDISRVIEVDDMGNIVEEAYQMIDTRVRRSLGVLI